jgi:uncharacterized protein YjiS (DUF1127 family)
MAHTIEPKLGGASGAATKTLGALKFIRVSCYKALEIIMIWQERAEQRCALKELDTRQLKDIGITRVDATREAAKPFWLP